MVIDIKNLILSMEYELNNEVKRRNSIYEYTRTYSTQESVDKNKYLAILALKSVINDLRIGTLTVNE